MHGDFHSLYIRGDRIKLDELSLKGVIAYEIISTAAGTAELTIKLSVGNLKVLVD